MNRVVKKARWVMCCRELVTVKVSVELFEMYEDVFEKWEKMIVKKHAPSKASEIMIRAFNMYLNDEG